MTPQRGEEGLQEAEPKEAYVRATDPTAAAPAAGNKTTIVGMKLTQVTE